VKRLTSGFAVGIAVVAVAIVIAVSVFNWGEIGNAGISVNGWIALILGVLVTLALGIGLMALVFISNRRGYDEPPDNDR
jgi:cation transporter-like permease